MKVTEQQATSLSPRVAANPRSTPEREVRRRARKPAPVRASRSKPAARAKRAAQTARTEPATFAPSAPLKRPAPRRFSDAEARALVQRFAPLVRQIAGGFQRKLPRNVLRDDLVAAGMVGLWDAVRRHGAAADETFEWYVRVRVRGAILDELRAQDWLPRRARATAEASEGALAAPFVVRLDDVSDWEQARCLATNDSSAEASLDAKASQGALARAVEQLPERERHIVSMHYFKGVKFKDLGAELGVSEPRISQLHTRAMQRLRAILADAA